MPKNPPASAPSDPATGFRSGFASFVGRPNAGKSTLTNALVGTKVAITSSRPQTTRTVVRGIVHRPDAQLILVDTPGLHRPRTLLGERLNDLVKTTWAEVDVVAVCFPANEKVGPGDRFIVNELAKVRRTIKIAVATKTDLATPEQLGKHLLDIARLGEETGTDWAEIVPVSAVRGDQVELLADLLVARMPEGPPLYPDGELTDSPEEAIVAELIREAALEGVRDELPHSIAVVVEEMGLREDRPQDKPLRSSCLPSGRISIVFATHQLPQGLRRRGRALDPANLGDRGGRLRPRLRRPQRVLVRQKLPGFQDAARIERRLDPLHQSDLLIRELQAEERRLREADAGHRLPVVRAAVHDDLRRGVQQRQP